MNVDVILWDYDGTLVDSVPKNIEITKQILKKTAPRLVREKWPKHLTNVELYHQANHESKNWQDLYLNYYGMTQTEMLEAGKLWAEFQLKNNTPVHLFAGIKETISQITFPQGICSQNSTKNIKQVLKENKIGNQFHSVVGYDDLPSEKQKPDPEGGIHSLNQILGDNIFGKTIIYIGDHESDVVFARNIEKKLNKESKVVSIVVKYSGANTKLWQHKPDIEIDRPNALLDIISNI